VVERAPTDAVDPHDEAAGRVGTRHARIGLHPIRRVILALLGRHERDCRLKRVEAEVRAGGERDLAAL
jgi:hypothetical protein